MLLISFWQLRRQGPAERGEGAHLQRVDRAFAPLHRLGDLRSVEAGIVAERDYLLLVVGQLPECGAQVVLVVDEGRRIRLVVVELCGGFLQRLRFPLPLPIQRACWASILRRPSIRPADRTRPAPSSPA